MGSCKEAQAALFYEVNLKDHVPSDNLLRSIDRFVDLSDIRSYLRPFYRDIGRPSIDPVPMIRRLLVGYIMGILPHIPVFDRSKCRDGTFPSTEFVFNHEADEYTCPGDKRLKKYWRKMTKSLRDQQGRLHPLLCPQERLLSLRPQGPMHTQSTNPQNRPAHLRRVT